MQVDRLQKRINYCETREKNALREMEYFQRQRDQFQQDRREQEKEALVTLIKLNRDKATKSLDIQA